MSAPSFINTGAIATAVSSPNLIITAPSCDSNDLLLAFCWSPTGQIVPPAGWTTVYDTRDPTETAPEQQVFAKQAQDVDSGATFTFGVSSTGEGYIASYDSAYGVDVVAVTKSHAASGSPASLTVTTPAVSTTRANELVIESVLATAWGGGSATLTGEPATNRVSIDPGTGGNPRGRVLSDQPQTVSGLTPTQTVTVSSPGALWTAVTLAIYPNSAPNAPALTSPVDSSTVDVGLPQRFAWTFSDPDPGDSQSAADLRYSSDGGATWTPVSSPTPSRFVDIPAGTFTDGDSYEWQVRTYDKFHEVGPWSTSRHFTAATPPAGPTITNPTPDESIGEATLNVEWSYTGQQGYQLRVLGDLAGAPDLSDVIFDTGQVIDATARALLIDLDATAVTRHVQVSIKSSGLWSSFTDVRFTVNFDPPPAPTITLSKNTDPPTLTVYVTTPDPGGGEIPAASIDVLMSFDAAESWERVATGLPINSQWTYWVPACGTDYLFRAVAFSDAGSTAYSDWVGDALLDPDVPEVLPPLLPGGRP